MDELLLVPADSRRGTRASRRRGAMDREDGARGREDPGGGDSGRRAEEELLVGCLGRRLEGGSMDLVTGEIEQRRNSTPLDRTREAEGGGCGGWSMGSGRIPREILERVAAARDKPP